MNKKRIGVVGAIAAAALAFGAVAGVPAHAADKEIVIWGDEKRGANL